MKEQQKEPQRVRAFVATIPDRALSQRLIDACRTIKDKVPNNAVHWIPPSNLHVTLRFLGNLNTEQLELLPAILSEKLAGYRPFTAEFDRVRWFPSAKRPRVIAACFKTSPELHALAVRVELAARAIALSPGKRPFRGHLTLARYRGKEGQPTELELPLDNLHMRVDQVVLFSSRLTPNGPIYKTLHTLELENPSSG